MAKPYFKPSAAGQRDLRNSEGVQKALLDTAKEIEQRASGYTDGLAYTIDVQPGQERAHARVTTANEKAYWVQLRTKNLTSAVG